MPEREGARNAAEIGARRPVRHETGGERQPGDIVVLVLADFEDQRTAGREHVGGLTENYPVGIEPVVAAVERAMRIVFAHFRRQGLNVAGPDIGRVLHDQIAGRGDSGGEMACGEGRASRQTQSRRVGARHL